MFKEEVPVLYRDLSEAGSAVVPALWKPVMNEPKRFTIIVGKSKEYRNVSITAGNRHSSRGVDNEYWVSVI